MHGRTKLWCNNVAKKILKKYLSVQLIKAMHVVLIQQCYAGLLKAL